MPNWKCHRSVILSTIVPLFRNNFHFNFLFLLLYKAELIHGRLAQLVEHLVYTVVRKKSFFFANPCLTTTIIYHTYKIIPAGSTMEVEWCIKQLENTNVYATIITRLNNNSCNNNTLISITYRPSARH
jgi:hypothetical protein